LSVTSQLHTAGSPLRTFMDAHFRRNCVSFFVRTHNGYIKEGGAGGRFQVVPRTDASRIGTAITYRIVLEHTSDLDGSPAHRGAELVADELQLESLCDADRARASEMASSLWEQLRARISVARAAEDDDHALAPLCLVLADLDNASRRQCPLYLRNGDDALVVAALSRAVDLDELISIVSGTPTLRREVEMLGWLYRDATRPRPTPSRVVAFPEFTAGRAVGGADGDLLLGDELIEVKATGGARPLCRTDLLQLLAYVLLDTDDAHGIRNVSMYYAYHAFIESWSVDFVLQAFSRQDRPLAEWRQMLAHHLTEPLR
jgi:hypothetical protein